MNDFPVKFVDGRQVFLRDVAHVHSGYQTQTNLVTENGAPGALLTIRHEHRRGSSCIIHAVIVTYIPP